MKQGSRTDIAAAILGIAVDGAIKTETMYRAFLSFPQLKEYLTVLEDRGCSTTTPMTTCIEQQRRVNCS
ncbi:MAG TPA: winged helix-turn-helix domain-containing protein [Nitrososphaera sp.]|nr:winged helix-turn-helix domain-containing protein [Nitrososphaera sp.]